jgi:hypothetical protein
VRLARISRISEIDQPAGSTSFNHIPYPHLMSSEIVIQQVSQIILVFSLYSLVVVLQYSHLEHSLSNFYSSATRQPTDLKVHSFNYWYLSHHDIEYRSNSSCVHPVCGRTMLRSRIYLSPRVMSVVLIQRVAKAPIFLVLLGEWWSAPGMPLEPPRVQPQQRCDCCTMKRNPNDDEVGNSNTTIRMVRNQ